MANEKLEDGVVQGKFTKTVERPELEHRWRWANVTKRWQTRGHVSVDRCAGLVEKS